MGKTNQAFIGKLCIRNDDVVLVVSIKDKKNNLEKLSSQCYLLWTQRKRSLPQADTVSGIPPLIDKDMSQSQ